jgi:hypothetical protein
MVERLVSGICDVRIMLMGMERICKSGVVAKRQGHLWLKAMVDEQRFYCKTSRKETMQRPRYDPNRQKGRTVDKISHTEMQSCEYKNFLRFFASFVKICFSGI